MRRYHVPAHLRTSLWGELDPRLKRSLRVNAAVDILLSLVVLLVPAQKPQPQPLRILERRAARLITPGKKTPERKVQTPTAPKARQRPKVEKPQQAKAP